MSHHSKVITFVGRKGGSGKSTSALYTTTCLHEAGKSVALIDLDPDATLLKLHSTGALPFEVVAGERDNLPKQIEELNKEFAVLDTPPNDEAIIYKCGAIADELIVPLAPSGFDLNRLFTTIQTVEEIEKMRNKPLLSALLTRYRQGVNRSVKAIEVLEKEKVPLLDSKIRMLDVYAGFNKPEYLDEYQAVLKELELL